VIHLDEKPAIRNSEIAKSGFAVKLPRWRLIVHVIGIGADHMVVDVGVQLDSEGAAVHADFFQHASFDEEMSVFVIILVRQAVEIWNERDRPPSD
jgi:hypothetical protein